LLDATADGRKLDGWEIEAYIWMLMGNVAATPRNPEQRRRLAETPHLMPHAIEEFLRVFSPVHALGRTVMHDVELAGQSLKSGDRVLLCWVSGNLDETEFENPEEVDSTAPTATTSNSQVGARLSRVHPLDILQLCIKRVDFGNF
jgi:hypothetical protein